MIEESKMIELRNACLFGQARQMSSGSPERAGGDVCEHGISKLQECGRSRGPVDDVLHAHVLSHGCGEVVAGLITQGCET